MKALKVFSTIALMSLLFVPVLNADTVGQWLFDEGSGNVVPDSSGHGNDGTFVGEPEWVTDTPWGEGFALRFDGADNYSEYIEIEDAPSLNVTDEITVEAWFKITPNTRHNTIVCKGGEDLAKGAYYLGVFDDFSIEGNLHVGGEWKWSTVKGAPGIVEADKWQHLAMVWDGSAITAYLNGVIIGEGAVEGTLDTTDDPLYIACSGPDGGEVYTTGLIDEVRISDRALSIGELGFNSPLPPTAVSSLGKLAVTWNAIKQR